MAKVKCGNCNADLVEKFLGATEGWVHARECDLCAATIHRDEARYHCEKDCNYDVCRKCWDSAIVKDNTEIEVEGLPLHHFFENEGIPSSSQQAALISSPKNVDIQVVTWNVGSLTDGGHHLADEAVRQDVLKILSGVVEAGKMNKPVDVLVLGLQEVIPLTVGNAVLPSWMDDHASVKKEWVELLTDVLDSHPHPLAKYTLYGEPVHLFGLFLCVFSRSDLAETHMLHFSKYELPVDTFKTGTKGIVACRFSLYDRSFCFMNCHLQALTGKTEEDNIKALEERFEQIRYAWRETEFSVSGNLYGAAAHRAVFLLGDTNMRLNLPATFESRKDFGQYVQSEIAAGNFQQFQEFDQLKQVMQSKADPNERQDIWRDEIDLWEEPVQDKASMPFPPTFKLEVPGPGYSSKRAPAWTDRILCRSQVVRPLQYHSLRQQEFLTPSRNVTDHDPVHARFEVACVQIDASKFAEMVRNEEEACQLSHSASSQKSISSFLQGFHGP
eukprot:gnl/TRDRNA2_/TRDRNA2_165577_c1_seq3.p1 gnl/TRDRNA2_/TRDRNA2_165577_c1~~gnl/TRDRNA2_/TRDRNA2_165577_c1_seq3.p1  ORF type:complete len:499 (+),score=82.68 gnl/TRDRNA2_/TRDRNA2_165577_c1_seq3:97-1593(+)